MGSVLVINPSNLGLAKRLAYEGTVVRVFNPPFGLNGDNPRKVGSLKMLDQYDFLLESDLSQGVPQDDCCRLGSGHLNKSLYDVQYLMGVINNLCDAVPLMNHLPESNDVENITINSWFNGQEFLYSGYYIDYMRMSEGEKGPVTEGMGYMLWKANPSDELLKSFLGLNRLLRDLEYRGPITIGCLLTEEKVYFGQISSAFQTRHLLWHELVPKGLYNMFLSLSVDSKPVHLLEDYAIGVRCITLADQAEYRPNYKVDSGAEKHFYEDMGTARGDTVYEVRRRVYRTLKNVCKEDKEIMFRSDIGAGVEAKIGKLKRWGWLRA